MKKFELKDILSSINDFKWEKPAEEITIQVESEPKKPVADPDKEFLKVFRSIDRSKNRWEVWNDFVTISACAISNCYKNYSRWEERENLYLKTISKYKKKDQIKFPELLAQMVLSLEANQNQDFLGKIYMQLYFGENHLGQIFTPYNVCELMSGITITDDIVRMVKEKGYITILDHCCGTGATLIAAGMRARDILYEAGFILPNRIILAAQDIDQTVALMCYIQMSLLGFTGFVKIGNSLTEPMDHKDSLDDYWVTPMYRIYY